MKGSKNVKNEVLVQLTCIIKDPQNIFEIIYYTYSSVCEISRVKSNKLCPHFCYF